MADAVAANPLKRQLHEGYLWEAKARRAKESGYFSDPLVPDSYRGGEELQKAADALLEVEFVPHGPSAPTVPPGDIMKRGRHPAVHKVEGPPSGAEDTSVDNASPGPGSVFFKPIKESKL